MATPTTDSSGEKNPVKKHKKVAQQNPTKARRIISKSIKQSINKKSIIEFLLAERTINQ
jgi:hypothetical protein